MDGWIVEVREDLLEEVEGVDGFGVGEVVGACRLLFEGAVDVVGEVIDVDEVGEGGLLVFAGDAGEGAGFRGAEYAGEEDGIFRAEDGAGAEDGVGRGGGQDDGFGFAFAAGVFVDGGGG